MHAALRSLVLTAVAGPLLALAAAPLPDPGAPGSGGARVPVDSVTFADDVAPVLYENCATCHRPEGPAPFSLLGYDAAREKASDIAEAVRDRYMPPWLPEAGHRAFAGERRLTPEQIDLIGRWAEAGAPAGDLDRAPPAPEFSGGWRLGQPDLVLEMPAPFTVRDSGRDVFRNFVLPAELDAPRWVEAVEVRPGNAKVVHHAMVLLDETRFSRVLADRDRRPGYEGMLGGRARPPEGFMLGWTPGKVPQPASGGTAWRLDPGTDLVLQLHLRPSDRPQRVRARVGLHFADGRPERRPLHVELTDEVLDIPAGDSAHVVRDRISLPVATEVLGVYPHAHYLAKEMKGYAVLPDGGRQWLIHIRDWNFDWQDSYRFAEPVHLPAGSELVMEYSYDNSASNPQNPHDPPRRVLWGLGSGDEMAELHLQVLAAEPSQRGVLQGWLAARGLPHTMEAYLAHYRRAVETEPEDGRSRYQLGAVLAALDRPREALPQLRRAADLMPDWWLPPMRTARLLATTVDPAVRDPEEALRLARRAVELSGRRLPMPLEVLALAHAAAGDRRRAAEVAREAAALAAESGRPGLADRLTRKAARYDRKAG